ncbi:hypothetical protein CXU05_11625 [Akkermansia muciniphila]|nr:hypothetical protein CXU05_11625 [Akkermansia muciniphila]
MPHVAARTASRDRDTGRYQSHRPEQTLLYQIVDEYYPAFAALMAEQGKELPGYVQREFEEFLQCGRLEHGFLRVRCESCHAEHLVAFSCKRRGFCPSCGARRMAESAALLVDEVLPEQPMRQWVLSFPFQLRFLFGVVCGKGRNPTLRLWPAIFSGEIDVFPGDNGGGYFGVNSSHPLENPTYLSNMVECWSILIIPMAMVLAFGFYLNRKKLGYSIYGVMLFAFLIGVCVNVYQEMNGNPRIEEMGIVQESGAMEGKEIRLGSAATALWSVVTTVTSNGSVNGMHDSTMPLSGMIQMLNMQINTWFGGVGVGWMNYFAFMIIAVFISGLMVGRTPEFLCKKVEAREMKIASIVALLHPFVILVGTALACYLFVYAPSFVEGEGGWVNNPGFHGLSEFLYEYTSSAANNGSGFEGLSDNTWFWNYSCGIVLILSRFIPIVGQVAIAGLLAGKKYIPETSGTLKTDSVTFSTVTFAVIFIVAALSFFPVHALSTIAEHLSL